MNLRYMYIYKLIMIHRRTTGVAQAAHNVYFAVRAQFRVCSVIGIRQKRVANNVMSLSSFRLEL